MPETVLCREAKPVADGILRVDVIMHVPALLRRLGIDPEALLAELGLERATFGDPTNTIPFASLGRLTDLVVKRTGCTHFGLLVGQGAGLGSIGLVGRFAQNAPDVGTALRKLTSHFHLRDRGAVMSLSASAGSATLGYDIYQPGIEAPDQICDGAIAIAMNAMRTLCGRGWRPSEVRFSHATPADLHPFRSFFGAPLRFDCERTALVFPARWLEHRPSAADPGIYESLERQIAALESSATEDLVVELRRILRTLAVGGEGSVEEVARRLALHRRTLNRRLQRLGTSVHQIVEQSRHEAACHVLEHTRMPMMGISSALGYADASAFTRAFRRWTGQTPSAWREQRGARPPPARADGAQQSGWKPSEPPPYQ
jgi:AraC-like DNA-binding protein